MGGKQPLPLSGALESQPGGKALLQPERLCGKTRAFHGSHRAMRPHLIFRPRISGLSRSEKKGLQTSHLPQQSPGSQF